jgi:gamma-glutamyltranspeptidase / glutathione hydrolase
MKRIASLLFILLLASCAQPEEESYTEYAPFNRSEVSGTTAAVVSGHPLASAAGHEVLLNGGNAVDAAVTMAAVLAVVRPHMNGIGGDAFGLFYDAETGSVTALNGSGRSGELASAEFVRDAGYERMPQGGAMAVTVPGALSAWVAALERYGTLSIAEALQPAIRHAEEGFPVTPTLVRDFASVVESLNEAGQQIYTRNGSPLQMGERLANPALAQTLRTIADEGPEAFYGGEIGQQLAQFVEELGGSLRANDFEAHRADWGEPLTKSFNGLNVHVHPPSTQGIALTMQLAMAERFDLEEMGHNSADYLHTLTELKKLAFADRDRWVADYDRNPAPVGELLSDEYLSARAELVTGRAAESVEPGYGNPVGGDPASGDGDTVYLMAVDADGNAVSWIQSIFSSFGSKLVEPETGIVLQNRGGGFTLEEGHPNRIEGSKRPFHTLTPALVTGSDGSLKMTLGTPGGHGQTQTKMQVLHNIYLFGMHPQEAVEAPRYRSQSGLRLAIENRIPLDVRNELRSKGHELQVVDGWSPLFGGAQLIWVDNENGVLRTAADPRREAAAIAY